MVDEELLSQNEEKVVENKEEKKTLLSIKDLVVNSNSYIDSLQKCTSKIMDNEAFS